MRTKIAKVVNSTAYLVACAGLLAAGIIGTCVGLVEMLPVAPAAFILMMMPFVFEEDER